MKINLTKLVGDDSKMRARIVEINTSMLGEAIVRFAFECDEVTKVAKLDVVVGWEFEGGKLPPFDLIASIACSTLTTHLKTIIQNLKTDTE